MKEIFNTEREVLIVYSEFGSTQPRILHEVRERIDSQQRLDPDIALLATRGEQAEKLARVSQTGFSIIPINIEKSDELPNLKSTLAEWLPVYDRYDVSVPLRSSQDLFGRDDILGELNYAMDHGHSVGIFGLRKAGKTSILNALQEHRSSQGNACIQIDLSGIFDDVALRRELISAVFSEISKIKNGGTPTPNSKRQSQAMKLGLRTLDEVHRGSLGALELEREWISDLRKLIEQIPGRLELLVDEIDTIYPGPSSQFEREELDGFYRTLRGMRSLIQETQPSKPAITLISAGVEPSIFESSILPDGKNNQIYKLCKIRYLGPLGREDTARMVRRLGELMGIKYRNHPVVDALYDEYGGHPLLTRFACSQLAQLRPAGQVPWSPDMEDLTSVINRTSTESALNNAYELLKQFSTWFPDEGEYLRMLWAGTPEEHEYANQALIDDMSEASHAFAYGLLEDGTLRPRIGALEKAAKRWMN